MKVSKLTNGLLVLLVSAPVLVVADSKYPATDFQPKVVYQDSDYKQSGSSAASSSKSSRKVSAADSNYPAANFEPEVLYQDKGYKHTKDKVSSSSYSSGSSSTEVAEQSASAESDESSFSLMLGLLIVAVAGFIFYKKGNTKTAPARKRTPVQRRAAAASSDTGGLSGVAKYLETKAGPLVSGVAKYLQERESVALSGVAKYVAKQKVSQRTTETKSVSGVDKYLKDRG